MPIALFDVRKATDAVREFLRPLCQSAASIMVSAKAPAELVERVVSIPAVATVDEHGALHVPDTHIAALDAIEFGSSVAPVMFVRKKVSQMLMEKMEAEWRE